MDDKVAITMRDLRAPMCCMRRGDGYGTEQMAGRSHPTIARHQCSTIDRSNTSTLSKPKRQRDCIKTITNPSSIRDSPVQENAKKRARTPRLTNNAPYEACSQSTAYIPKSSPFNCHKLFGVTLVLSVMSMAASSYVGYQVIIEGLDCNCPVPNGYRRSSATVKAVDHGDIKKKLNAKIMKLKGQLQEIQNDTRIQFSNWCKKTAKECQTELIDNLTAKLEKTLKKIELHLNKSKEGMKHKMEIARTKLNETTKVEKHVLEALIELNETISKQVKKVQMDFNLPADQCKLQRKKRTANKIDFLFVAVPYRSENRITVGVTCSTSIKNAPKTIYLTPPTEDDDDFKCCCHNDDDTKDIDCFAYYWQCKMS